MKSTLNVSRVFKCDAKMLFNAIGEGMLIRSTGAIEERTKIDFKVGGRYEAAWDSCEDTHGEFLEINPYDKIVFTWNKNPKNEAPFRSTVTVLLVEQAGTTTLHLSHEGLPGETEFKSHDEGWVHTLKKMYSEFENYFAEVENNVTGLDVNFSIAETVNAPLAEVFEFVRSNDHLTKFFKVKMNSCFEKGKTTTWDFEGHPTFELKVHEVIRDQLIKFQWGDAHVAFTFFAINANSTRVRIHATGFKSNKEGLNNAFSECNGWTEFLMKLKKYAEKSAL